MEFTRIEASAMSYFPGLLIFIMASPFLLFFAAAGIMAFHRSKPAHTAQEQMMMRKAEQRQTKILTFAIPFIIFVPYIIWVVLQPGPIVP